MPKITHYFLSLLIVGSLFLSSCSDPPPQPAEPVSFPTLKIAPSSTLSIESSLRLSRQIQLLTNNTEIVRITNTKSMVPTLDSNTLVIIEKITFFETLKIGDIIVYKVDDPNSIIYNELILHRIYFIDNENKTLITKGDNNDLCDPEVKFSQIYGRVFCIIYASEEIK